MVLRPGRLVLMACAFAFVCVSGGPAKAIVIAQTVQSLPFNLGGTAVNSPDGTDAATDTTTLTFNKFNGPGSLSAVQIDFVSTTSGTVFTQVLNGSGIASNSGTGTYSFASSLASPFSTSNGATAPLFCIPNCFGATAASNSANFGGPVNGSLTPAALASFLGPGTFDITPTLDIATGTGGFGNNFSPFSFANTAVSWDGTVEVIFSAVIVPGPPTLMIFAVGALGLLAFGRSGRRRFS